MPQNATIQTIKEILPHNNADSLELAKILGWTCVVRKGEFHSGDKIVYISIDSVVPDAEWTQFLKGHFRIKTIRLRGELSQGLILSCNVLPQDKSFDIGDDVSSLLSVAQYEKPISAQLQGENVGIFPTHLCPKTDEVRIQNFPQLLDELCGKRYIATVKCDGTSSSFIFDGEDFYICSRNNRKKYGDNVYSQIAVKYDLENKMRRLNRRLAIQGEICGPGIQKNRMGLKETELFVFDMFDLDERQYLCPKACMNLCNFLGLTHVPIAYENICVYDEVTGIESDGGFEQQSIDQILDWAKGNYPHTNNPREGIVFRPLEVTYSPTLCGRLSFKVINNDYLLKHGE